MATHTLLILYNGTDSFYDRDINIPYNPAERFEFGEIVSRVGHHAQMTALNGKAGEDRHVAGASTGGSCDLSVLRVNGVSDETHKGGTALGRGMEENVQLGMQEIKRKRKQYNNDIVVVAMGWSRGGITCMALARAIEDKFGSAAPPVHLIVYDPVAGKGCNIGGWSRDWWNIKVSSFTGFYARDEKTAGFSPTIPKVRISNSGNWWADEPRVELIGVRGTHSNLVGNVRGNVPNDPFNQGQSTAAKIAYKRVIEITLDKLRYMQLKGSGDWCRKLSKLAQVVGNGQPNLDGYTGWGAYSTKCQGMRIDPTLGQLMDTLTGRGVFIGDNSQCREWSPNVTPNTFMNSSNATAYEYFMPTTEKKIDKVNPKARVTDIGN